MTTSAKVAYLSALIDQSRQREARYETSLASATTPAGTQAGIYRLDNERSRQRELQAELNALPQAA